MNITLREVEFPDEQIPVDQPQVPQHEYVQRIDELYSKAGTDWVIVYGDREHLANLKFLTNYDPRFEEALLLVGPQGARFLVVGNEGRGYASYTTPWIEALLSQSMSLAGQPRDIAPRLYDVLKQAGLNSGASVGIVGWKYLETEEDDNAAQPAYVPAYMLDIVRRIVGQNANVNDVTQLMMHPQNGMRAINTAAQIAAFEWSAMRASAAIFRIVKGVRPGMTGFEAAALMHYEGDPLSAHVMFVSGKTDIVGLCSPNANRVEQGDGVTTAVSYWGSLVCRAGMVLDRPDKSFFDTYCVPYFRVLATWYQSLRIGASGAEVYKAVVDAFGTAPFGSLLNPGHLVSYDEWVHSPIRPDSRDMLASGMALQSDIIPSPLPQGLSLNCEDTLVLADKSLRSELAASYPDVWQRVGLRRQFMHDALGIHLAEEVLPLSTAPAFLPPFWLRWGDVCTAG